MYRYVKKSRNNRKQMLLDYMGAKCIVCSYNKCNSALDFHHLDPRKKEFSISQIINKSVDIQLKEVRKCVVLCATCHREHHAGMLDLKGLKQDFHPEILEKYGYSGDVVIYKKARVKRRCFCGNNFECKEKNQKYCSMTCARIGSRKVVRPTKKNLKMLIWKYPMIKLSQMLGVSDKAISKWCDYYGLKKPGRGYWLSLPS